MCLPSFFAFVFETKNMKLGRERDGENLRGVEGENVIKIGHIN